MGNLKWVINSVKKSLLYRFLIVFFLNLMAEIGLLFLPLLYGEILNIVEGTRTFPKGYFITLLFLTIILLFLRSFSGYFNGKIKVDIHENISLESIKKIFKIPPVKLAEKGSKYYTDIILERSSEAADIFDFNSMTGFLNLIKLIVITGIILFLDITIFFVSIILVLLSLYLYKFGNQYYLKNNKELMETRMDYFSNIEDTIKNKEEITIYNAISGEIKRNDYYTDKIKKLAAKLYSKYFAIFFIKLDFLRIFYELFVFSFSLYQVYTNNYSIGTAIVLIGYSVMITGPISYLNSILLNIKNSINAIDFLRELDVEEEQGEFLEKGIENISFNKVNYSVDGREILKDLSFTINKGEKIALLGPSGKGKSTIVSLILKDIPLTNGQITINNIDLKGIAKEYLYAQIAVLSQTSRLFPGTVEENLLLGNKGSNKEELEEMLKKFKLPFQLQYLIDENSANISQGEKERILLARALLANKNFVILDEPLEGVDLQNKGEILSYLKNYLEDKTAIIITHREEVGAICNKVIKL